MSKNDTRVLREPFPDFLPPFLGPQTVKIKGISASPTWLGWGPGPRDHPGSRVGRVRRRDAAAAAAGGIVLDGGYKGEAGAHRIRVAAEDPAADHRQQQ